MIGPGSATDLISAAIFVTLQDWVSVIRNAARLVMLFILIVLGAKTDRMWKELQKKP